MTPSRRVLEMIVVRFLSRWQGPLTLQVSPYAEGWLRARGAQMTSGLMVAATDEWIRYRDLARCERMINDRREVFAESLLTLVTELPGEVDRYTTVVSPNEFRVLLAYGGREVYDFFVRGHRFGAPPRGRAYRSDVRGAWNPGGWTARRDQCLVGLRARIRRCREAGADVADLLVELERRTAAVERGEDPMEGRRRVRAKRPRPEFDPVVPPREGWRAVRDRELVEGVEEVGWGQEEGPPSRRGDVAPGPGDGWGPPDLEVVRPRAEGQGPGPDPDEAGLVVEGLEPDPEEGQGAAMPDWVK